MTAAKLFIRTKTKQERSAWKPWLITTFCYVLPNLIIQCFGLPFSHLKTWWRLAMMSVFLIRAWLNFGMLRHGMFLWMDKASLLLKRTLNSAGLNPCWRFFPIIQRFIPNGESWSSIHSVSGKQAHDTRIAAAMNVYGISQLLTFNVGDFKRFQNISIIDPAAL